ncbi:Transportin-1 [Zea mays]|uniref:Transportin-1 n=1 Tax=Zea mays TaxID=4577 RepID=A0A1D6JIX8_MAIZE|nr:Transportin-1 [Zea mays]
MPLPVVICDICFQIGKEIAPVVITVVSCLVPILKSPEGSNKSLVENSAITLGRLSWVCPDIVAPHMEHFMQAWCKALCMIRDDFEKEDSFHGLCAMVAANPTGGAGSLAYICQACASWTEIKSEGLHNEVCQILNGYKQLLGNGGWEQCMATLQPDVVQKLARYGV